MRRGGWFAGMALAGCLLAAWFFLLRPEFLGGPAAFIIVSGRSMEPTLHTGDLVITRKQSEYRPGDVVALRVPKGDIGEGSLVIHRIVGGSADEGFLTKGDNKPELDRYHPREGDIVGRQWLHLPGKGRWLATGRQPQNFAALVGGIAAFSFLGGKTLRKRRRRKAGFVMAEKSSKKKAGWLAGVLGRAAAGNADAAKANGRANGARPPIAAAVPGRTAPLWAVGALGMTALLAVGLGYFAYRALSGPAVKTRFVERARYEQRGVFDYTVVVQPSTLYPAGVIGPVTAPEDPKVTPVTPPVYTKQAVGLDLGFSYSLGASLPPDLRGELSAELQVRATGEGGWVIRQPLLAPTPFQGTEASTRLWVGFAPIQALIERVEAETGFTPGGYELVVVPSVHVTGAIGRESFDAVYAPAFTLKYNKTTIVPDGSLRRSEAQRLGETVRERQNVLGLPVPTARWLLTGGSAAAAALASLCAAVVFLGLGQDEATKVRVRYGTRVVPVMEADHNGACRVQVARLEDLAALAQREGKIVFVQRLPDGDLYFLPDGAVTYEYASANGKRSR